MAVSAAVVGGLINVAPSIAKFFNGGNKTEAVAEAVVGIARQVTGKGTAGGALSAIEADPVVAADFRRAVIAGEQDLEKAYLADVQDARARDVALQLGQGDNRRGDMLAYGALASLIGILIALFVFDVPDSGTRNVLLVLVGTLSAIVKDVYGFEFGSSRGSKNKDQSALMSQLERLRNGA